MSSTAVFQTGIGVQTFLRAPNYVNFSALGASSAVTITIPPGCRFVELRANLDFYVKWGTTGVSTAAASDGSASEIINVQSGGVQRNIGSSLGTTAISVMSTAPCSLTQSWWSI